MTKSALVLASLLVGSTGFLAEAANAAQPANYGCGDDDHKQDDKDESFRLCGDDDHKQDDKDESFRLCGDDDHKQDDKDESFRLCGDDDHKQDDKDESFRP